MGIWKHFFGKKSLKKPEKSPYLPKQEDPIDLSFAKNFTSSGGYFLYNDSLELVLSNFNKICLENNWEPNQIVSLNQNLSDLFQTQFVVYSSGKLDQFEAALIHCEYLIGNTGKILLSKHQINHFKLDELPQTIIVSAKIKQLTRDVSQGMSLLKSKYEDTIPTNITTLKTKSQTIKEKNQEAQTNAKNIYLLLEDF